MRLSRFYQLFYRARRIRYRFQEEGALPTFQLIFQFVSGMIFRQDVVLLFSRDLEPAQLLGGPNNCDGLTVTFMAHNEIDDLLRISYTSREEVLRRIADGDLCLVARLQGRIVHYSWLTAKSQYAWEIQKTVDLKPGQYYLYNCRTVRAFRGRGIYKAAIAKAMEETLKRNGRSLAALIRRNNTGSQRVFHAMGFEVTQKIFFRRLGTNRQYKEKFYATAVHTNTAS